MYSSRLGFENYTAQVSLRDPANKAKYIGEDQPCGIRQNVKFRRLPMNEA
jgi:hypothetical protein